MFTFLQSINAHLKRDPKKGVVNNQILDWSFKLDGIFHNATQEHVFSTVASDMVTSALDGYNGKCCIFQRIELIEPTVLLNSIKTKHKVIIFVSSSEMCSVSHGMSKKTKQKLNLFLLGLCLYWQIVMTVFEWLWAFEIRTYCTQDSNSRLSQFEIQN